MIVTFISQCQKHSLKLTRQVLDAYANRIGERTWQTVITQEGLHAVKSRLAKTARKTTAVACHRMHGTSRTELVWIVGNKREFDVEGNVPVNRTQRDLLKEHWENDWQYLQMIKVLVALSALFHDVGKSWDYFQTMLEHPHNKNKRDPIRHEWISLLLFKALTYGKTDAQWLGELVALSTQSLKERQAFTEQLIKAAKPPKEQDDYPFDKHWSSLATWIGWLIVTHHKLPQMGFENFSSANKPELRLAVLRNIQRTMGYIKQAGEPKWKFNKGLPLLSEAWCKDAARWAKKAQELLPRVPEVESSERLLLTLARLSLMLGDHNYSSADADKNWKTDLELNANTDRKTGKPKQKLDEHLVHVADAALEISHFLPRFETELPKVDELRALRKPAKGMFAWQNLAVQALAEWRKEHDLAKQGFFAINMASTGYGKTFANAKVMGALQTDNSLRFNLALGLRTLTLQTGDEYREKLHLDKTQLAVLIGSAAVRFLHEQGKTAPTDVAQVEKLESESGSASEQDLTADLELIYDTAIPETRFSTILKTPRSRQLLYAPVVVSTIDHLMPATESTAGGKHILPILRLMSADLVIDEVDDFDQSDMPAIARLVHLVGMLGRKLMISSATIPPAVAEGLFQAYQAGWTLFANSRKRQADVTAFWLDEFGAQVNLMSDSAAFQQAHQDFVTKRLRALEREPAKRKALLQAIERLPVGTEREAIERAWFERIVQGCIALHRVHAERDEVTGKHLSLGVVRVANVDPCIQLTRYLLDGALPDDIEIRVMSYHARQVLLLRSEQENHLGQVLNRKHGKKPQDHLKIKEHLQQATKPHVIFMLVATPVEEVGRDHDLDWAVIEPSSMRSIIQMAGRVWRHRPIQEDLKPNILLLERNLASLLNKTETQPAFYHPGYESKAYLLNSHSLKDLVDEPSLANKLDAAPRIQAANPLKPHEALADLEHQVLQDVLLKAHYSPALVQGWLHCAYYLTRMAQQAAPFRDSDKDSNFKLHLTDDEQLLLRFPEEDGKQGKEAANLHIETLPEGLRKRLWLPLDYADLIASYSQIRERSVRSTCEFLGEVRLEDREGERHFSFTPELGFQRRRKA
ncbi:MAG TPA: type I-F CRISPR-associated helicase Cas3f [Thiolinea sp.]|nr:type I-F CRISPR-associated helicase Cas3f [Thiolinea sp.]